MSRPARINCRGCMGPNTKIRLVSHWTTPSQPLYKTRTYRVPCVRVRMVIITSWSQLGTNAIQDGLRNTTGSWCPELTSMQEEPNSCAWMVVQRRWPVDTQIKTEPYFTTSLVPVDPCLALRMWKIMSWPVWSVPNNKLGRYSTELLTFFVQLFTRSMSDNRPVVHLVSQCVNK